MFLLLKTLDLTLVCASLPSAVPLRGIAVVPAGVWIQWAGPCQGLRMAMESLSALPGAVAKAGREPPGHWQEHRALV